MSLVAATLSLMPLGWESLLLLADVALERHSHSLATNSTIPTTLFPGVHISL